jgi:hypothetical protein
MRQPSSESDQPSIQLMWEKVRDAASDAILRAPSVHAEVIEPRLETDINQTRFPWLANQGHVRKRITFRKLRQSGKEVSRNTPPAKTRTKSK